MANPSFWLIWLQLGSNHHGDFDIAFCWHLHYCQLIMANCYYSLPDMMGRHVWKIGDMVSPCVSRKFDGVKSPNYYPCHAGLKLVGVMIFRLLTSPWTKKQACWCLEYISKALPCRGKASWCHGFRIISLVMNKSIGWQSFRSIDIWKIIGSNDLFYTLRFPDQEANAVIRMSKSVVHLAKYCSFHRYRGA